MNSRLRYAYESPESVNEQNGFLFYNMSHPEWHLEKYRGLSSEKRVVLGNLVVKGPRSLDVDGVYTSGQIGLAGVLTSPILTNPASQFHN